MTQTVLSEVQNGCGIITLNRPEALNALSSTMIDQLRKTFSLWKTDNSVDVVVIRGAGKKAFCAGGDVKEVYHAMKEGKEDLARHYFKEEYTLNFEIANFPKPTIAFCHGYTMGGGMGISMYTSHRVVTESSTLAMPENAIGLFPDVGASYFLQKCPGLMGRFMAVTGTGINAAEALYGKLATHYVKEETLDILLEGIKKAPKGQFVREVVGELLDFFWEEPDMPAPIKEYQEKIDFLFSLKTVEECLREGMFEKNIYIKTLFQKIAALAPLSLKLSYAFFDRAYKVRSLKEALLRDLKLSEMLLKQGNFIEGVRAKLIDKDQCPEWKPSSLEEITPDFVTAFLS